MKDERTIERVAREATGRLTALLARRSGDLALAEDALSQALIAALERWPEDGVPKDPEAWLYTVARRKLVGVWRHADVRRRKADAIRHLQTLTTDAESGAPWPDERLPLLFVCGHEAIDPTIRAPLMLQAVLGMTADTIGPLMGVASKTMGQRLWRAKTQIKQAGIPFSVPEGDELLRRVTAVLDAIYGLYSAGWTDRAADRTAEALWLAEVVTTVLPDHAEAWGLLALLRYADARTAAGRGSAGEYVPFTKQDPDSWNQERLDQAEMALHRAQSLASLGPFQLEAAIQSALVHGQRAGRIEHASVLALYEGLVAFAPTLGNAVGRAAALADVKGPTEGLAALDTLTGTEGFQPYWAVRAALLHRAGQPAEAAYEKAIALTADEAVRTWLMAQRSRIKASSQRD
ncbi:MAG: DUF6596 domain-containing protein [Myxococcota bacterium]